MNEQHISKGRTAHGVYIRTRRIRLEMSQRRLGDLCGASASAISDIELGESVGRPDLVSRIAEALGADPSSLLTLMHESKAERAFFQTESLAPASRLQLRPQVLYDREQIDRKVTELAGMIESTRFISDPVVVGVLDGAAIFVSDLVRKFARLQCGVDFVRTQGMGGMVMGPEGPNVLSLPKADLWGRSVVLVEDVVETGRTLSLVIKAIQATGAAEIRICALVDKPWAREVETPSIEFKGFEAGREFLVGYGLDLDGAYRQLDYIGYFPEAAEAPRERVREGDEVLVGGP